MTPARLRILIVGAFPPAGSTIVGGIATSCQVLLQSSLPARAHLTLVDSSQASNPPPAFLVRAARAFLRSCLFVFRFERARPQVVVLFSSPGASTLEKGVMAWYTRARGCPTLLLPRGMPPERRARNWVTRAAWLLGFGGASRIVCQGTAWQEFAIAALGRRIDHAPVVNNWTATPDLLGIGRARQASAAEAKWVSILYLGWVEREKGVLDLLEACRRLPAEAQYELNIVGDGHAMAEVRQWIAAHDMYQRVHCHGWLRNEQKLAQLRTAEIFALPSWAEGLPNAMIEAMACRVACVVSAVGNIPSTIGTMQAAVLVAPRAPEALANALARLIADHEYRKHVADAGFSLASERFEVEQAVDALLSIAQDTLEPNSDART